jgi:glycosyltransferase involved in cell wall biosynthesis
MARPDRTAHVLINGRAAARPRLGGVERWAREMVDRLPRLRPDAYGVARPPAKLAHRAGQLWEQAALPALAAGRRAGLLYSPANLAPLVWPRNVVLIHDVAALRHPEWYTPAYVAWQRRLLPAIARRARGLVTVSEFSRGEVAEALDVDPRAIAVIAGGVDDRFHPGADAGTARRALGLERPYVFTLATRYPRKNPGVLARAAAQLAREGVDLVSAGGERSYMRPAPAASGVRTLGYVPDELLPGLYAGARAFVLASRDEGFGLPCLEAMASGAPVVAASSGALPETCGGAALLVDPDDAQDVAAATMQAALEESERERLRSAGLARARTLTWERAARETDALLQRLARPD